MRSEKAIFSLSESSLLAQFYIKKAYFLLNFIENNERRNAHEKVF